MGAAASPMPGVLGARKPDSTTVAAAGPSTTRCSTSSRRTIARRDLPSSGRISTTERRRFLPYGIARPALRQMLARGGELAEDGCCLVDQLGAIHQRRPDTGFTGGECAGAECAGPGVPM